MACIRAYILTHYKIVRTEAKSLSSSSPDNIQLLNCNGAYSVSDVKRKKKADIKETFLIEYITTSQTRNYYSFVQLKI